MTAERQAETFQNVVVPISTKNPVLGETSAAVSASYGERNDFNVNGIFNIPLDDFMAVRVTGFTKGQDGYVAKSACNE